MAGSGSGSRGRGAHFWCCLKIGCMYTCMRQIDIWNGNRKWVGLIELGFIYPFYLRLELRLTWVGGGWYCGGIPQCCAQLVPGGHYYC